MTPAEFRAKFPKNLEGTGHFDNVPDVVLQPLLDVYGRRHPASVWGEDAETALTYAVAHHAELYQRANRDGAGNVSYETSYSSGVMSAGHGAPTVVPGDEDWVSTTWGRTYLSIRRGVPVWPGVA